MSDEILSSEASEALEAARIIANSSINIYKTSTRPLIVSLVVLFLTVLVLAAGWTLSIKRNMDTIDKLAQTQHSQSTQAAEQSSQATTPPRTS